MTTYDDREKAFEQKFAHDAELKFRAESRRNKMLGEWAGNKLGLTGTALADYIASVRKADLAEVGDHDVVRKVKSDLSAKGIIVSEVELQTKMGAFFAQAMADLSKGST